MGRTGSRPGALRRPTLTALSLIAIPWGFPAGDLSSPPRLSNRVGTAAPPLRWGASGHEMAAHAAAEGLPADMPRFFRASTDRLTWLNPEPDRWRSRPLREMDQAWSYDHYIDLENVPAGALDAPDRFVFLKALYDAGLERPERDAGFLPFRIVEMYQRLVTEWRSWRAATGAERAWIEQRILDDAGVMGHYVTDASQPHHTTIHFNGWNSEAPNPEGFGYDRDFHGRFEAGFVDRWVQQADVSLRVEGPARSVAGRARAAVMAHILEAHAEVPTLYRLERDLRFDPDATPDPALVAFTADRLGSGADMLRTLWWSAWLESATPAPQGP